MQVHIYTLQSFVKDGKGGNAAGVVPKADHLTYDQMQVIAKQVGFSETAFVQGSDAADFKVSFFTPSDEVDLCGHATIAAFSLLHGLKSIEIGAYKQETKAGVLSIEVREDGKIFYDQTAPIISEVVSTSVIAEALDIPESWITNTNMQPQVVSTGLRDIIVGIDSRDHLFSMSPNFEHIKLLSSSFKTIGIHVFTLDTIDPKQQLIVEISLRCMTSMKRQQLVLPMARSPAI